MVLGYSQALFDGMNLVQGIGYFKSNEGETLEEKIKMGQIGICEEINGEKTFVPAGLSIYLDNTDLYIHSKINIEFDKGITKIYGNGMPGVTVYISQFPGGQNQQMNSLAELKISRFRDKDGNFVSTIIDENGSYSFDKIEGLRSGQAIVWYKTTTTFFFTANLTAQVECSPKMDLVGHFIYKTRLTKKYQCPFCKPITFPCPVCGNDEIKGCLCCQDEPTPGFLTRATGQDPSLGKACEFCEGTGIPTLTKYYYSLRGDGPKKQTFNVDDTIQLGILPPECYCSECQGIGLINSSQTMDCPAGCGGTSQCTICGGNEWIYLQQICPQCNGEGTLLEEPNDNQKQILIKGIKNGGSLWSSSSFRVDTSDDDKDGDSSELSYQFTWARTTQNIDQRAIVWTYVDDPTDEISLDGHIIDIIVKSPEQEDGGNEDDGNEGNEGEDDGVSGPDCLAAGTLITMADGSQKLIENIHKGEYVIDKNGQPNQVYYLGRHLMGPYHTYYYFDDGTVIHEVYKHRFFNVDQGFYQLLKNWNIGDRALKQNGEMVRLISKEIFYEDLEMFAIYTSAGTYYANNLLSGQAFCNREFFSEMTPGQAVDMLLSIENEQVLYNLFGDKGALV